jgi:hypothetical protein
MGTTVRFTAPTCFEVEGARVGVSVCEECGAAILIDPRDTFDAYKVHDDWHDRMNWSISHGALAGQDPKLFGKDALRVRGEGASWEEAIADASGTGRAAKVQP